MPYMQQYLHQVRYLEKTHVSMEREKISNSCFVANTGLQGVGIILFNHWLPLSRFCELVDLFYKSEICLCVCLHVYNKNKFHFEHWERPHCTISCCYIFRPRKRTLVIIRLKLLLSVRVIIWAILFNLELAPEWRPPHFYSSVYLATHCLPDRFWDRYYVCR